MDEINEDDDQQIMISDVPFVAESDFLIKYGKEYILSFSSESGVVVSVPENS